MTSAYVPRPVTAGRTTLAWRQETGNMINTLAGASAETGALGTPRASLFDGREGGYRIYLAAEVGRAGGSVEQVKKDAEEEPFTKMGENKGQGRKIARQNRRVNHWHVTLLSFVDGNKTSAT